MDSSLVFLFDAYSPGIGTNSILRKFWFKRKSIGVFDNLSKFKVVWFICVRNFPVAKFELNYIDNYSLWFICIYVWGGFISHFLEYQYNKNIMLEYLGIRSPDLIPTLNSKCGFPLAQHIKSCDFNPIYQTLTNLKKNTILHLCMNF
jgi:hypothetical protein